MLGWYFCLNFNPNCLAVAIEYEEANGSLADKSSSLERVIEKMFKYLQQ